MSAPNLKEIEWAISELEKEESGWAIYSKLADLYTVRKELSELPVQQPQIAAYSEAEKPTQERLGKYGDSDFLHAVAGKPFGDALAVIDELMETLKIINPRVYSSVLRKISAIK